MRGWDFAGFLVSSRRSEGGRSFFPASPLPRLLAIFQTHADAFRYNSSRAVALGSGRLARAAGCPDRRTGHHSAILPASGRASRDRISRRLHSLRCLRGGVSAACDRQSTNRRWSRRRHALHRAVVAIVRRVSNHAVCRSVSHAGAHGAGERVERLPCGIARIPPRALRDLSGHLVPSVCPGVPCGRERTRHR
jgi:hypothetical protein